MGAVDEDGSVSKASERLEQKGCADRIENARDVLTDIEGRQCRGRGRTSLGQIGRQL